MEYNVIGPDGQKYGPADLATLSAWAAQNRLNPTTQLEEIGTGRILTATQLPGLVFGAAPAQPNYSTPPSGGPVHQPGQYGHPGQFGARPAYSNSLTIAWVLFAVSLVCCGVFASIPAYIFAKKADTEGNPGGKTAKIVTLIFMILQIVGTVAYIGLIATGNMPGATFRR